MKDTLSSRNILEEVSVSRILHLVESQGLGFVYHIFPPGNLVIGRRMQGSIFYWMRNLIIEPYPEEY